MGLEQEVEMKIDALELKTRLKAYMPNDGQISVDWVVQMIDELVRQQEVFENGETIEHCENMQKSS